MNSGFELFIRNHVGTTLLTIALALAGILAFEMLPVAPLPEVEFPTIQIQAQLPGASPETMASSVATPLERQLGRIAGLTEMTSTSSLGQTAIVLQFDLNRNIDAAARDVQAAINAARDQLPAALPSEPTYRKVNPADAPILIIALTSATMSQGQMYDAADSILAQKLSQEPGVGQVFVGGGALPAVRVELNPTALNHEGLSLEQVRTVLAAANANRPKGELANNDSVWTLSDNDQILRARFYRPLIISYHNGAPVELSDVAQVTDSVEDVRTDGMFNAQPAVLMIVFRQSGANIISTVATVKASMLSLAASIPSAIKMSIAEDRTVTIRASVHDVELTLLISIALVVMVVFVFLRNLRATAIPGIVVPLSLIGTFGVMYLFGYSIDNLSLMALTISTGFVVDDAIVVIENITRYLDQGCTPYDAAVEGTRTIGFTVMSISLSLVAVFIPILLMGGIVGRLFREFAVTLAAAVVVSMVVSLTTTPMMCAKLLRPGHDRPHGRLYRGAERGFDAVHELYRRSLSWVLRHSRLMLSVALATLGFNIYLFYIIPKGFFPEEDTGRLAGVVIGDQATSFQLIDQKLKQLVNIVRADPAVANVLAFTGGRYATNQANMYIQLKPRPPRELSAQQLIGRLRKKTAGVAGVSLYLQAQQDLRIGAHTTNAEYQYTLQDDDLQELMHWAPKVLHKLQGISLMTDLSSDQQNHGLEANLVIDRKTAARLGISPLLIDDTLYDAFGQRQVSVMYTPLNQYHVVMELAARYWQNPQGLNQVYVGTPNGGEVPLSAITHYAPGTADLTVNHQGQFPAVTLSFNLAPGVALGQAVDAIQDAERQMHLPTGVRGNFQGSAHAFQTSLANEPTLILAALLSVYIVLGILYESYIHPITILSTLPSAGVGALLALLLFHIDLSVIAIIGIILLIGIVKKNAILMIDFALDAERNQGKEPAEAIYQACLLRFRPILMTTMAAMLGGLPLALGTGVGSELRRPLGISIVGGLLFSQLLTLYSTPVIYLYLDRLQMWVAALARRRARHPAFGVASSRG